MGAAQSSYRGKLLYQQVTEGNVDAIKALHREGAHLEWTNDDGKTPLAVACMDPRLYTAAKTLIDLGAKLNYNCSGQDAGTALHHAAKRGLDQTVSLLLQHGANPFARNDDHRKPLEVARKAGFLDVVRCIEKFICYFSGYVRVISGLDYFEAPAPQLLSSWAVVTPCKKPPHSGRVSKLKLAVYSTFEATQPRTHVRLWKCEIEEPKLHHSDLALIIFDQHTETGYKFVSAVEGDKLQLQRLYDACKGISRGELVYQQVIEGNVEAIKALFAEGASLEWRNEDGKTPLVVACMDPGLYMVVKTLIDLGADLNYNCPGAGTALHHAANRGLFQTVSLLLQHGANPFVRNDDFRTPLEFARAKGFTKIVRWIEEYICYFSGHFREIFGPDLEAPAPRKIWAVVIPRRPPNSELPPKLLLAVYSAFEDAQPLTVVSLWESKIEKPNFHQSDPALIIFDQSTLTRYKFASPVEGDQQQLRRLYKACEGIPQPTSGESLRQIGAQPSTAPDIEALNERPTPVSSCCNICIDAQVEGAFIPCGHMVGCMSCMEAIIATNGVCPLCRAEIHQVIKIYAV